MKKSVGSCLILSMALVTLAGCGNAIPEMDDTTRKMVVEYAADVVREHDLNRVSRLMEVEELQMALEEEAMMEAVFSKDYSTENTAEEIVETENSQNESVEVTENASESEEVSAVPLAEALTLEDAEISYAGYEVTKSYPENSENIYFTMDATAGNRLVVLKFDVTNTSSSDKSFDILSKGAYFKIVVDGESKNALTTMLLNDLSNYQGTIAAGAKEQLVLVCEVSEEMSQAISEVALNMKTADGTIAILLK